MFYSEAYHAVHLEISVYIVGEEKSTRGGGGKHSNKEACYLAIGIILMKNEDVLN